MAKATKKLERWFDVPGDPDGAKVLINLLKPGERRAIESAASQTVASQGPDGQVELKVVLNTEKRLELMVRKAAVAWDGFFDPEGQPMPFSEYNAVFALGEFDWFAKFFEDCDKALVQEEKEAQKAARGKLIALGEWLAGEGRLDCKECREFWERQQEPPPCAGCHPGVHRYNQEAYELWPLVGKQFIWAAVKERPLPVAISLPAIEAAMRIAGTDQESRAEVALQVLELGDIVCELVRKE